MRTSVAAGAGLLLIGLAAAAPAAPAARRASLEAYFAQRSSQPGRKVRLVVLSRGQQLTVQLFRAGAQQGATRSEGLMGGAAVADARTLRPRLRKRRVLTIWLSRKHPSGLYYARLRDSRGEIAVAPIVLRNAPQRRRRVAVVLPTHTWQAYNYRDDDADGVPNSWYASPRVRSVALDRPFIHHGVPPHYDQYDLGFLRWLIRTGKAPDFLADDDLEAISGPGRLRRRYDLVVFAGHEEYVTTHVYDLVKGYRDRGGNLMFLSANNFFYRVTRSGNRITRAGRWRDLGRPEARWIGSQYLDWNRNLFRNAPFVVTGARAARWLFRGTGLTNGSRFGSYGIEIDARTPASPPGTLLLARAPNIFGPGRSAEMTYHQTPAGAKVFAAGAINFGGSALNAQVGAMLDNLWRRLSRP